MDGYFNAWYNYDVSSLQLEVDTKKRLLHKHYSKFQHRLPWYSQEFIKPTGQQWSIQLLQMTHKVC